MFLIRAVQNFWSMPLNRHHLFLAIATVAPLLACRCTEPKGQSLLPEFVALPTSLSFEACPDTDENGNPVVDVFAEEQKVVIRNDSRVPGDLVTSITGTDAAKFKLDAARTPAQVGANSEVELPVLFLPSKKGESKAELVIDDGVESTQPLRVTLRGNGRNYPSQPTLKMTYEDKDQPGTFKECEVGRPCEQVFPDTLHKESSTLTVKVTNVGCPALRVTGIELLPYPGRPAISGFFIDSPSVLPSAASPQLLTTADGASEQPLVIRFSPEAEGGGDTSHIAILRVHTNDPNIQNGDGTKGVFDLQIAGAGLAPSIYSEPTYCEFSDPKIPCGYTPKLANKARFQIKNGGTAGLKIEKLTFKSSGTATSASGRFTITTNIVGQTIPGFGSLNLDVDHSDMPLYVNDVLTVEASAVGGQSTTPQRVSLSLGGGTVPCMTTEPDLQLSFEDPTDELTKKTIRIKNGAGCGTLVVNKVAVDTNPFFSVVDPLIAPGEQIAPGAFLDATIQYKKPVAGGQQASVVRFQTNDPQHPAPEWKPVRLYSKSELDQVPVAVLKGCKPSDTACVGSTTQDPTNSMSVRLQDLTAGELTLHGKGSYDPPDNSTTRIKKFQFRLVNKPSNAMTAVLENNGMTVMSNTAKLTLDALATGTYRATLLVWDDKDQQSPISSSLTITVNP